MVSHFHADHIGGLKDFPKAQFICSKSAYNDVRNKKGISALRKGFIPSLMPADFHLRTKLIDFNNGISEDTLLGRSFDVFNDGSILLFALDGHAKGQIGAKLQTASGDVLLVSDAAWLRSNYVNLQLPHPVVRLFFDSWKEYKSSLKRLHQYYKSNPTAQIIPSHCEATYRAIADKWH